MGISIERQMLIEQRVANESKSAGLAYVLWFFFGALGVHRFYLGHIGRGLVMLGLFVGGLMTAAIGVGLALLLFLALWLLLDLFFIPALVAEQRQKLRRKYLQELSTDDVRR